VSSPFSWYYAKRCFLALLETLSKHMLVLKDDFLGDVLSFLDAADQHGKEILTVISQQGQQVDPNVHNVAFEARLLKKMFHKLRE
jgi:tetratricopeptide repeat protein 30